MEDKMHSTFFLFLKNVDNKGYIEWIVATTSQIKRKCKPVTLKIKCTLYIKSGIDYKC